MPTYLFSRKAFASEHATSPETAISTLMRRIRRLSPPQQATLKALCQHLARVADHEYLNKMSASNLGLIFSTVVFGEDEGATLETLQNSKVRLSQTRSSLILFGMLIAHHSIRTRQWNFSSSNKVSSLKVYPLINLLSFVRDTRAETWSKLCDLLRLALNRWRLSLLQRLHLHQVAAIVRRIRTSHLRVSFLTENSFSDSRKSQTNEQRYR